MNLFQQFIMFSFCIFLSLFKNKDFIIYNYVINKSFYYISLFVTIKYTTCLKNLQFSLYIIDGYLFVLVQIDLTEDKRCSFENLSFNLVKGLKGL